MMRTAAWLVLLLAAVACRGEESASAPPARTDSSLATTPAWARDAVWYQVFVERFRNGDASNDPTPVDMVGVTDEPVPAGWAPTPWGWDWYAQEPWARATGRDFYGTVQFRRYGGDLQGLRDQLDYLQALGVTALYLNPINDAPSLHKYDARSYAHVDRNFGPDPRGDAAQIAREDFADPSTWQWTAADRLFLELVQEIHRRGMRVILDYSWNHTGITFPAWQDVVARQRASPYADWYEVAAFDDPATPDTNEFRYRGWLNVPWLPEWKKTGRPAGQTHGAIDGTLVPGVRDLVFAVTRRWLDPNGDGDPSDGVDGFRLDVADMVPLGFWREYRRFVRGINPEAYLVGEVWWQTWPDTLYDPRPWLRGDVFDAVMHYHWFTPTRQFFAAAPPSALSPTAYAAALDALGADLAPPFRQALMNLTASHDTPRFATTVLNAASKYKYRETPREDRAYRIGAPDAETRRTQELILVQQFTWVGAPHIWNGDEVGMWGADDPDMRKPIVWDDLRYDDERADPMGRPRPAEPVRSDTALRAVYRDLIALRRAHQRLFTDGEVRWLVTDDERGVLAYERAIGQQRAIVVFNIARVPQAVTIAAAPGRWREWWPRGGSTTEVIDSLRLNVPPRGASVWVR